MDTDTDTDPSKLFRSAKTGRFDCGDRPEPDFVPTREEVEQSRKLVEEVRRSTRSGEPQQSPKNDPRAARPFS
jgi:hypothetical protein